MKKKIVYQVLALMLLWSAAAHAQTIRARGVVRDKNTADLLSNVSVFVKGSSASTMTDTLGSFGLEVAKGAVLIFSHSSMETLSYNVTNDQFLNIELAPKAGNLENVVVIGYGTQRKKDITSAISVVSTKDISSRPIINTAEVLQGKAAGVQVLQPSGEPGSDFSVRIRGIASPNGSEPLYVIDGTISLNTKSLDPNSIESISVLKDASAAGIYGAAGSINGVVLITTKKGTRGKMRTDIHLYTGIQQITKKLDVLNARQSADLLTEAYANVGTTFTIPDSVINSNNNNWQDLIYRNARQTGLSAGFSGGSDKGQYYLGVGYIKQEGILDNSDRTRYFIKLSLEQAMNNWLKVGTNFNYNRADGNTIGGLNNSAQFGGAVLSALNIHPFIPVFRPGTTFYENGLDGSSNPMYNVYGRLNKGVFNNILGDVHAEVKLPYNFRVRTQFGLNLSPSISDFFESPSTSPASMVNGGSGGIFTDEVMRWTWENTLTYARTFNKHDINAVIGTTALNEKYRNNSASGNGYATGIITTLNAATSNFRIGGDKQEYANYSYFGRISYNYNSKYLVSATLRRDASSRFGSNNSVACFPAVSAAWRVSNEDFMSGVTFIQDLKIRAGYGETGNLPFVNYPDVNTLRSTSALLGGRVFPGYVPTNPVGNPNLKWETQKGINVGADFGILNNKLTVAADYYYKKTTDLIFLQQLPATSGSADGRGNSFVNLPEGYVLNTGVEFTLNANITTTKNFTWSSNFNISFNKNRVQGLDSGVSYATGFVAFGGDRNGRPISIIKNGLPLGAFWGYQVNGVNPATGDINYVKQSDKTNVNGTTITTGEDNKVFLGNGLPTVTYGFSNDFSYKSLSLNILIDGVGGNKIFNGTKLETDGMRDLVNATTETLKRWRKPGDITDVPRAAYADPTNNTLISSRFIESGAFARIRSATLSYQFRGGHLNKIGIQGVRLYVTGTNLLTITDYSGYYPEINAFGTSSQALGIDHGTYPQTKTYTFGVNVEL